MRIGDQRVDPLAQTLPGTHPVGNLPAQTVRNEHWSNRLRILASITRVQRQRMIKATTAQDQALWARELRSTFGELRAAYAQAVGLRVVVPPDVVAAVRRALNAG